MYPICNVPNRVRSKWVHPQSGDIESTTPPNRWDHFDYTPNRVSSKWLQCSQNDDSVVKMTTLFYITKLLGKILTELLGKLLGGLLGGSASVHVYTYFWVFFWVFSPTYRPMSGFFSGFFVGRNRCTCMCTSGFFLGFLWRVQSEQERGIVLP